MSTPDTVGPINRIAMSSNSHELATSRARERRMTASTVDRSRIVAASTPDDVDGDDDSLLLPTFEGCSRAVISAAERMMALVREPQGLAIAIAYDECLDIIAAAVNQLEETQPHEVANEHILDVYRAMRSIHEVLRPSPSVRRALHF